METKKMWFKMKLFIPIVLTHEHVLITLTYKKNDEMPASYKAVEAKSCF